MPNELFSLPPEDPHTQRSPFWCTECKSGKMRPIPQEGDAGFTDSYICEECKHRDTIPGLSNIMNQIVTSILGGGIASYLALLYIMKLANLQQPQFGEVLKHSALLLVSCLFIGGFVYVLTEAIVGIAQRRAYTQRAKPPSI